MVTIIPAIIPNGYTHLAASVARVKGIVPQVQIDVIDGRYAPDASWPYNGADRVQFQKLVSQEEGLPFWETVDFEIDLMVERPEEKVDDWIRAGAKTLIIHIESTQNLGDIFSRAADHDVAVAIALRPATDIDLLEPWAPQTAFIQLMGNDKIGSHGVPLDERVVGKIGDVQNRYPGVTIGVDIGVNERTIGRLHKAGATRFAAGSAVFGSIDVRQSIDALREAIGE